MLKKILNQIDLFSIPFGFKNDGDINFHTVLGGFISLLTFASIIVLSILFGKELLTKSNPIANSSKISIDHIESIIGFKGIPLLFYFENEAAEAITDINKYFQIDFYNTEIGPNHEIQDPIGYYNVSKPCILEEMDEVYRPFLEHELVETNFTCIDFNDTKVKNDHHSPDSNFIRLDISKCNPNSEFCKDFFKDHSTLRIYMVSYGVYIDNKDYNDPIKRNFKEYYFDLSKVSFINTNIVFSNDFILTDVGLVIEEFSKSSFINYVKSSDSYIFKDKESDLRMLHSFRKCI